MKSFSTIVLASITALATAEPIATVYSNADCTGETLEYDVTGMEVFRIRMLEYE